MSGKTEGAYAARVRLDVDAPDRGVQVESGKSTLLAEDLELIDVLISAVITGIGKTLGVLVGEDRTIGLHRRQRGQILYSKKKVISFDINGRVGD